VKNSFVVAIVVALLVGLTAEAKVRHSRESYREAAIDALQPAGHDTFVVIARGGILQVGVQGQKVTKKFYKNGPKARQVRDLARKRGRPVLVINEPVAHVAHRLDSVRFLNGPAWTAMSLLVSLKLDRPLAAGQYQFVLLSDAHQYVLIRPGTRRSSSGRVYTGMTITMGSKTGPNRTDTEILKSRGFLTREGYIFAVAELPKAPERNLSARSLMLRLQNRGVGNSPVTERLISVRAGA
jgi:hypothetical protein